MTILQKQNIENLRQRGLGYALIAESLGISINTVKSFCRRNNLTAGTASKETVKKDARENSESKDVCKQCGKPLTHKPGTKPKTFCGDKCRYVWWNENNTIHTRKCARCKCTFNTHGNKTRKYCSHACYISDRYGKGARHDKTAI